MRDVSPLTSRTETPHFNPWTDTYGPSAAHLRPARMTAEQYARVTAALRAYHARQGSPVPPRTPAGAALLLRLILSLPRSIPERDAGYDQPAPWQLTPLLRFLNDPGGERAPDGTLPLLLSGWETVAPEDTDTQRRMRALIGQPAGGTYQYHFNRMRGAAHLTLTRRAGEYTAELHVWRTADAPVPEQLNQAAHDALCDRHPDARHLHVRTHLHDLPGSPLFTARLFARDLQIT